MRRVSGQGDALSGGLPSGGLPRVERVVPDGGIETDEAEHSSKSAADEARTDEYEEVIENDTFKGEKYFKKLLVVFSVFLIVEIVYFFIISPAMPLSNIEITGADDISKNEILSYAGITPATSYFAFNVKKAETYLSAIPEIESADVIKVFPDTVKIVVHGRKPAALSLSEINGRCEILVYDKNGVIFSIGAHKENIAKIPVISGIVFENVRKGMRLPVFLIPLLEDLSTLEKEAPELLSVISEIRVNKKAFDNYDLTLYPETPLVRIRTGIELKEETLSYILLLLDVLRERGIEVEEVDFRTGTASYITKQTRN